MKIISVMNVKGGVGKSITAECLARGFATRNKTLLVDGDGQGDATHAMLPDLDFDNNTDLVERTISAALTGRLPIEDCIWSSDVKNLDVLPSNMDLFDTIYELQGKGGSDFILGKLLNTLDYDYVIIDNNPSVNKMLFNSIYASDVIICPTNIGRKTLKGVANTRKVVMEAIDTLPYIKPIEFRLLLTMIGKNRNSKEGEAQLRDAYGDEVLQTKIRYQQKPIQDAEFGNVSIMDNTKAGVADDYRKMVAEVIGLEG